MTGKCNRDSGTSSIQALTDLSCIEEVVEAATLASNCLLVSVGIICSRYKRIDTWCGCSAWIPVCYSSYSVCWLIRVRVNGGRLTTEALV